MKNKQRLKVYYGRREWSDEHGRSHRVGQPAVIYDNGLKIWKIYGTLHRLDGPAIESDKNHQYFAFGIEFENFTELQNYISSLSEQEIEQKINNLSKIIPIDSKKAPKKKKIYRRQNFEPLKIKVVSNFDKKTPEIIIKRSVNN